MPSSSSSSAQQFCFFVFLIYTEFSAFSTAEPVDAESAAAGAAASSVTFALQTRPFLSEPSEQEPILVREGEPGPLLNCSVGDQFRDRNRFELEWTKVVGDTPNLVSRNGRLFAASGPDGYELLDSVPHDGGYNLRLKQVQLQRDNGRFFCALIDTETRQQTLSEPARVVVLVPPGEPQISAQPTEAAREGDFLNFRCESSGGNPPPRFQWLFDNKTRVPEGWFHDKTTSETGKSVSSLQMHVKSENHGIYLTCQVWNRAMKEGDKLKVETNKLNVLYAPRVHIIPAGEELNVEEGEQFPLTCRADANPPAGQYQWTHVQSGEVHRGEEWRLAVRRGHSGEFRCTASNSLDSGSARVRLNVLYGPTVHIKVAGTAVQTVSPAEGDRLVLDCEAEANPKAKALAWEGPGGIRQNGSRLVLDSVNRAHAGNFTCTAWNSLALSPIHLAGHPSPVEPVIRTGVARLAMDVRRKPGPAMVVARRVTIAVGEPLQLGCSAEGDPGSPTAKFKWAGPGSGGIFSKEPAWHGAQLHLAEAQLQDNGVYRCVAYNELGQGEESSVHIMVVEPARITRALMPSKTVSSNLPDVQLDCEARGYPQPRVGWLKDGLPIPADSQHKLWTVSERISSTGCAREKQPCPTSVQSNLRFSRPTSWADKGNYSCVADNSAPGSVPKASSSIQLSVIHEPVILNQRFADGVALAAADLGTTARLSCLVSARPEPKISWSRDGLEIGGIGTGFQQQQEEGRHYRVHLEHVAGAIDEVESVLELDEVADRDFGIFVCEARNGAGGRKSTLEIRLQPRGRPQVPAEVKLLEAGLGWLQVGWRPGFDGGQRQAFELEYRPVDPYSGEADNGGVEPLQFTFGPANWSSVAVFDESAESARPEQYLVHNLTLLRPQSFFFFRVRALSARGSSEWTALTSAGTADVRDSADVQAPEHLLYLPDERRLVVQPLKRSAAHCLLVYVASGDDSTWRSIDCFPLANSDGSIPNIGPAERFKARYCLASDVGKCSSGIKIFVENLSTSAINTLWMLAFIVASVCLLSFTVLTALLCCRRRFQKANRLAAMGIPNGGPRNNGQLKRKKLNLNGGTVVVDRTDSPLTPPHGETIAKNTPVNGSQTDSGVFTLCSSSAAATAVAVNGMNGAAGHNRGNNAAAAVLAGMCGEQANNLCDWPQQQQVSPQHLSPHQLVEPYDFSNDPFLQEFAAANALGGIVVVENSLHRDSSAESSPSARQTHAQQNSYAKFFNDFLPSAFLGHGSGTTTKQHNNNANGNVLRNSAGPEQRNSNEQLLTASREGSAASSSPGGAAQRTAAGSGRVMREIIV